ncbi:MAG: nickel pincer cofactor biosynthesis protein LarB [Pseudomonadales bacterium]|nr:nickel pincer cofactor biosynthesis protein LarB [Pseudomonadales bacterium]
MAADDEVLLDFARQGRTGLAEAVFCSGKRVEQLDVIASRVTGEQRPMLFTRLDAGTYDRLHEKYPALSDYDEASQTLAYRPAPMHESCAVAIVSGGSSDVPVSREASRTLAFYGHPSLVIDDVGVAGLWRLLERLPEISRHKVVIAVAGMDAALPTVLGGLIGAAMIAVPTSVGYGMVRGGETALQSLLVSCAPGVTVVNIDNGYGAACAAIRILNQVRD